MSSLALQAQSITKSYAGVRALRHVSFDLRPGEVHALVGENGAGKSTLIRIITGAETPDSGTLAIFGEPIPQMDPALARVLGIAAIYQQPTLFPHLTVAENIALSLERGGTWRRLDWRERDRVARALLSRAGAAIAPERLVETLSLPEQQQLEIATAIGARARILIMDEPTATLSRPEAALLFQAIARLRDDGVGIIYISHRLEEVLLVADRTTVLRDGETVATLQRDELDHTRLIQMMVGRAVDSVFPQRHVPIGEVAMDLRHVSSEAAGVRDVSLSVHRGEILGIAGLVGSGRTELAQTIFGLTPADSGEIVVGGVPVRIGSPADAIALGIAYVPEDRRQHGVVLDMPVAANISLASLPAVSRLGLIDRRREREVAERYTSRLGIKAASVLADAGTLSGGNQQKVALARWLSTKPAILILDEPTQGVDVGAKSEIHGLMHDLTSTGLAIIMISSDLSEVLGMSDRIAVMRRGTITSVLSRDEASQEKVLALALDDASKADTAQPV